MCFIVLVLLLVLVLDFFIDKCSIYSMLTLVVLGGELAVPYSRNPLKRG